VDASTEYLAKYSGRIVRSAKVSKVAFAIFGTIGSAMPFLDFVVYPGPESLVSAISLSLAISLAYVVFYSLQVLPSFSNAESFSLLSTLPIEGGDFSLIAMFSFVRTFDYLAVSSSILQITLVWLFTRSIGATLLMVVGCFVNMVFAVAVALWFSRIFYKNANRGGRSKKASFARLLFLVTWGFAAMSIGFIFNFISYILPFVNGAIGGGRIEPSGLLVSALHPFSISLLIANIAYPSLLTPHNLPGNPSLFPPLLAPLLAYSATLCYLGLAVVVGRRMFHSVLRLAHGDGVSIDRRGVATDLGLKVRSSLLAHALKDLRFASKNPATAFLYALPLFVILALALITTQFPVMHTSAVMVSTVVGSSFTLLISTTLLSTDTSDREYTLSLPVSMREVIDAKTLIATLAFLPVPLSLLVIGLSKQLSSGYSILIPFIEVLSMYAACSAEVTVLGGVQVSSRGRKYMGFGVMAGSDVARLVKSLAISFSIVLAPMFAYAVEFVKTTSYPASIFAMVLVSLGEVIVVRGIIHRMTKSS
jgi:predicted permease